MIWKPVDWHNQAVARAAYGLRLAGKDITRPPNLNRSGLVWPLIADEGHIAEFHRLAYISFLVANRAPSEALLLQSAHKGDELELFTPHREREGHNWEPCYRRFRDPYC